MMQVLELLDHAFKADMIKVFQRVSEHTWNKRKRKESKPQQSNRRYNQELTGNFRSENTVIKI